MTTTKSIPLKNLDDNYKARINQEIADLCDKNRTYKECIEMVDKKFRVAITRYDITKVTRGKDFKTYKKELIATDQSTKKIITKSTFKILLVITSILLGMGCIGFLILRVLMLPLIYPIFYWLAFFTTILIIFTILFTLKWYSKIRKSFSSPLKDTKISAVVIVIFIIIIVGVIQILLSIFRRELIYQISFVLLITSLIFQGTRTITTVSVSVIHKKIHKKLKTRLLVSIILPAYNEAKVIESTIYSLLRLSYQPKEIIVIDDGSTDATPKIVSDIARQESIIVISKPNEGKWSALNKGIQVAQGEIIICIDADTILDKGAIEYLIPYFQDKRIAAVAGNIKVGNRDSKLTKIQALEYVLGLNLQRRSESTLGKVTVVPGPLGAFRKSVLKEVGFFSGDTFAEDSDLTMKILNAGYKIKYEKHALGYTEAPSTFFNLAKQRYRWYRGQVQTIKKHLNATKSIPWLFFNGIILSWFTFFSLIWIFILMLNPYSTFVIYRPDLTPLSTTQILDINFFYSGPLIYIFWYIMFLALDVGIALYSISVDIKEKPSLVVYLIFYKFFYTNLLDTIRILSQLEEFLHYPMRWESVERGDKFLASIKVAE